MESLRCKLQRGCVVLHANHILVQFPWLSIPNICFFIIRMKAKGRRQWSMIAVTEPSMPYNLFFESFLSQQKMITLLLDVSPELLKSSDFSLCLTDQFQGEGLWSLCCWVRNVRIISPMIPCSFPNFFRICLTLCIIFTLRQLIF